MSNQNILQRAMVRFAKPIKKRVSEREQTRPPILSEVQIYLSAYQLSLSETLRKIIDENLSFTRFGDGELQLMMEEGFNLRFQENSPSLQRALRAVLESTAHPLCLRGLPELRRESYWENFWCSRWPELSHVLQSPTNIWGNSHVSRPYFFSTLRQVGIDLWRQVWADKKVTIITGKGSRFQLVNQLFDNSREIDVVYSVPVNAYEKIEAIFSAAVTHRTDIFLVSLGPAGTVLTHRLALAGRQTIDIGHLTDSYLHTFSGGEWPERRQIEQSNENH